MVLVRAGPDRAALAGDVVGYMRGTLWSLEEIPVKYDLREKKSDGDSFHGARK